MEQALHDDNRGSIVAIRGSVVDVFLKKTSAHLFDSPDREKFRYHH